MRNGILLPLSLAAGLLFYSCGPSETSVAEAPANSRPVKWHAFNEGIKLAKLQKKKVLVDFYADWCHYCRVMDETVFAHPEVSEFLEANFICVRVRTDREGERIRFRTYDLSPREFASFAGVEGLPTAVFMDADQNLITRLPGFIQKPMFLTVLKYIKEECYARNIGFDAFMKDGSVCLKPTRRI